MSDREHTSTLALGYARVSTEDQAREGVSLDAQREKIQAYSSLHDLDLQEIVSDELSGKRADNRPGLQSALQRLRTGEVGALIVVKLDRLTRSVKDCALLLESSDRQGWALHSILENLDTSSAMGRFVVNLMASLAQLEREQIGERTKIAMAHKRSRGEYLGGRLPYGYKLSADGVRLHAVRREQKIIKEMVALRGEGHAFREIARRLNARRIPTKLGTSRWNHENVRQVLRREEVQQ